MNMNKPPFNSFGTRPMSVEVYELDNPRGTRNVFSKWNGENWLMASTSIEAANNETRESINVAEGWFYGWRAIPSEQRP